MVGGNALSGPRRRRAAGSGGHLFAAARGGTDQSLSHSVFRSMKKTSRHIIVLPWVQLCDRYANRRSFKVGDARVLPDDAKTWNEVLQMPRPLWLDIFREFPGGDADEGQPARGTLLVAEDERKDEWLSTHISRLLGVIFVLASERGKWRTPAEALKYYEFTGQSELPDVGASFRFGRSGPEILRGRTDFGCIRRRRCEVSVGSPASTFRRVGNRSS